MALLDFLFGKAPSTASQQLFSGADVQAMFEQFLPLIQGQLTAQGQSVLGQAAAFGPGFQGTIPGAVAGAQNQSLLQLLNLSAGTTAASRETVTTPGTPGLIAPILAGLSGGVGMGLGSLLLGGGRGRPQGLPGQDFDALQAQQNFKFFNF